MESALVRVLQKNRKYKIRNGLMIVEAEKSPHLQLSIWRLKMISGLSSNLKTGSLETQRQEKTGFPAK